MHLSRLFAVLFIALASSSRGSLSFHVDVNTAPLLGLVGAPAPFSLDYQLVDGAGTGDGNNSVTLSNFVFNGGTFSGTATRTGGAIGSLASTITLTDSSFASELFQGFTPGMSLGFDVSMSTNVEAGLTPDSFSFGILDNLLFQLPTTDPLGVSLLSVDFNSTSLPLGSVRTYASTSPAGVTVTVTPITPGIPEPATALFGIALCGVCLGRGRRRLRKIQPNVIVC